MARQKKSKIVNVITWLLLLLLLAGGIGALCHYSGIDKDDVINAVYPVFRVEYGGKTYKSTTANNAVVGLENGRNRFEVKGTDSFSVVIVPNVTAETDFTFSVGNEDCKYSEETDLSVAFDLQCYDNAFTLTADDCSLETILSKIWGKPVTIGERANIPPYKIVVTSANGEVIDLIFPYVESTGLRLSSENIVF